MARQPKKQRPWDLYAHVAARIRDRFYLYPPYNETLEAAKTIETKLNMDGTPSKRPWVRYKCARCEKHFSRKGVHVDHIDPVIDPVKGRQGLIDLIERQFTEKLQVLCRPCHKIKTNEENKIRRENK